MTENSQERVGSEDIHVQGYAEGDDERLRAMLEDIENKDEKMKFVKEEDGVQVFMGQVKNSNLVLVMGKGKIEAPASEVHKLFADAERRLQASDAMYIHNSGFNKPIDSEHALGYGQYRMPKLVTNRDFLWLSHGPFTRDGDTHYWLARSVEHPEYPPVSGFVRGSLVISGYTWKPNRENPQHTDMCMLLQLDPKGSIPKFVVNLSASESAMKIARINKYFKGQQAM